MAYIGLNDKIAAATPQSVKTTINKIDDFNNTVNAIASGDFESLFGSGAILEHVNDSRDRFNFSGQHWNIPKIKPLFYVNFQTISKFDLKFQQTLKQVSNTVKMVDRPSQTFEVKELNEYNRKRLINGKIKYEPVNIVFYDTVDSAIMKILQLYKRFHYADFSRFDISDWNKTSLESPNLNPSSDRFPSGWGYHNYLDGRFDKNNYFFKQIDILEFFDNKLTVYNLIHPRIVQITLDPRDVEQNIPTEINIRFEYEGVTHRWGGYDGDVIGANMTRDVANFVGMKWKGSILDPLIQLGNDLEDALETAIGGVLTTAGGIVQDAVDDVLTGPITKIAEAGKDAVSSAANSATEALGDKFKVFNQNQDNKGTITGTKVKTRTPTLDF